MTITVYGLDGNAFDQNSIEAVGGRLLRTLVRLVLSGSYVTGGDTLDLTNGGGAPANPTTVPTAQVRGIASIKVAPIAKTTAAFSAVGGSYSVLSSGAVTPIPNSAVNALKLKLYTVAGSEYSAGAYGSDALGDMLITEIIWAR